MHILARGSRSIDIPLPTGPKRHHDTKCAGLPGGVKQRFVLFLHHGAKAYHPAKVRAAVHDATCGARASPVPIIALRVTRSANCSIE